METIEIIADFDFLREPEIIGSLGYDRIRGTASYTFEFAHARLQTPRIPSLSADLATLPGLQHKSGRIFGFLADTLPDRWGRRLIDKRERILAEREKRIPRTFNDFDYLLQVDDRSRMGALRFRAGNVLIGLEHDTMPVPPIASMREFVAMTHDYERAEKNGSLLREEWLENVLLQGSSLGGARPKANVLDEDGRLCIAKIPSINDEYDVALWEHFSHSLARKAGIDAAETRLLKFDGIRYHTLLSTRFDRTPDGRRTHFASAMMLCGLSDGSSADSGNGYLDIADVIFGNSGVTSPQSTIKELYRRIAFNLCIGNHDDHFRNHGFLLTKSGWKLSPAYDMNPTNQLTQSLLISPASNESSLSLLLDSCEYYMLEHSEAEQIVSDVKDTVRDWRSVAANCGVSKSEQERFARRLDYCTV